jgi:hypothetical protein
VLKCKYQNHKETFLNKKIKEFFILLDIKLILCQQLIIFSMDVIVEQDRRGITMMLLGKKTFAYFHHHSKWFEPNAQSLFHLLSSF